MQKPVCENCEIEYGEILMPDPAPFEHRLCPSCEESRTAHETIFNEPMPRTRDWITTANPDFLPSAMVVRVTAFLRGIFPRVTKDNWKFVAQRGGLGMIAVRLDPLVSLRMIVGLDATGAMIAIENPTPGAPVAGSLKRMALRNDEWLDIEGWVNSAKTWFDNRDEAKLKAAIQSGMIIDDTGIDRISGTIVDEETGISATVKTRLKFVDEETGQEVVVGETDITSVQEQIKNLAGNETPG